MPKEKKTQVSRLKSFILEFGDNVFSADGRVLFCKICEIKVEYERRSSVIQHIQTVKHVKMIKRREMFNTRTQQMITQTNTTKKSEGVSLADSIEIIDNVSVAMKRLTGTTGKNICRKMENVLKKNVSLAMLNKIKNILNGELIDMKDLPEDLDINDLTYFKYAPITSVNVERSFSAYKTLLTNNRRSFKVENIKKHLIIQCNASKYIIRFIILFFGSFFI